MEFGAFFIGNTTCPLLIHPASPRMCRILYSYRFIEHFSPYCRHCKNFAPLWEQLVRENDAKEDPGIHMAQVNCAVHGGTSHPSCLLPQILMFPFKTSATRITSAATPR